MTRADRARVRRAATMGAVALVAALFAGSTLPAAGAELSRGPVSGPARSAQPARVRVIVTLRDAADLGGLPARDRGRRLTAVISRLRGHADASQAPLRGRLHALEASGEVTSQTPLWVTNAVSVTATPAAVRELAARPDVASVTPDAITVVPTAVPAEPNIAAVHAPDLWAAGQTGQGVVVATLDTGVDLTNPDLAARWRGGANSWFDPYGQHPSAPVDFDGHGTATAGLIVGGADGGTSYGMAPGATLIAARVFDDRGAVSATAMHQAFQWLLDPDHDPSTADAPRVVNASWALGAGPSCNLSFQPDVQALRTAGILPVFSAGNFGPTAATSASPANYPESLSVGAVDGNDAVWAYSSAGPSSCGGRTRAFPDLVAPGVSVLSADLFGGYQTLTGTSVAAPHVAGAAALLLGGHPTLGVAALESALTSSAVDLGPVGPDDRYGAGRLDVMAADAWAATAPDFSVSTSPSALTTTAGGSASSAVTVLPVNGFAAPTTVSVQGLGSGASGSFTPSVVGPGAWSSTLVVTTTTALAPGSHPFTVTASGGGLTRSVPATLTVTAPPDFSVSMTPQLLNTTVGQSAVSTVTVSPVNGFTDATTLSLAGLGAGGSWSFTPAVVGVGAWSSRLVVTPPAGLPPGSYPLTITASAGGSTRSVQATLAVAPAPDIAISASPTSLTVQRGQSATTTISVTAVGGFTGRVAVSTGTLPKGVSATWKGTPLAVPGSAVLRLTVASSAKPGSYAVVVRVAKAGSPVRAVTLSLLVR